MGNKKSGNPVDTAAKIAPLDNKALRESAAQNSTLSW
ncbi:polyphosphate kinase [Klebsiella pneumoniae subsp. rhinoscleromatis]|nr:polyphosphate kinase [Klebsiella pneumoniae subsp. rhinoscleromatis]